MSQYTALSMKRMRGPLPISGSCSWLDTYRGPYSLRSSGCHALQSRRWWCSQFWLEFCSQISPPSSFLLNNHFQKDRRFLLSFCAIRAFTSFFTSAAGSGLSVVKWMVPLDVEKPFSSLLNSSITAAVGNRLQWSENAANHTSGRPLYLNAGIP